GNRRQHRGQQAEWRPRGGRDQRRDRPAHATGQRLERAGGRWAHDREPRGRGALAAHLAGDPIRRGPPRAAREEDRGLREPPFPEGLSPEATMSNLKEQDPVLYRAIADERQRELSQLELIASENFASDAVLEAAGSVMTNKYAEGLPRKRYYGGCEFVDVAEEQAIARVKLLFGAEHANVQPHSGASANLGAYFAVSKPGDTLLGMSLAHGGHLTHGHPVSLTGQIWRSVQYGVRLEDGLVDYDQVE